MIEHLVSTSCCYNSFSKINSNTKNIEITISPFGLFWLKLHTKTHQRRQRKTQQDQKNTQQKWSTNSATPAPHRDIKISIINNMSMSWCQNIMSDTQPSAATKLPLNTCSYRQTKIITISINSPSTTTPSTSVPPQAPAPAPTTYLLFPLFSHKYDKGKKHNKSSSYDYKP